MTWCNDADCYRRDGKVCPNCIKFDEAKAERDCQQTELIRDAEAWRQLGELGWTMV